MEIIEHASQNKTPTPKFYFFIWNSKVTLVTSPALTSTAWVALPRVSCQTSRVYLPTGTLSNLNAPSDCVTSKNGLSVTTTQPFIQPCTSQRSAMISALAKVSLTSLRYFGCARLNGELI